MTTNFNNFPELGSIINVQAYKYDGTLYRQWNGAKVLEVSPFHIVLLNLKTKVSEINNHKWVVREPTIWFFPLNSFFNAIILLRDKGNFNYINLASPPIFEENTLKYIDFDLDIKVYPEKDFSLIDQNEFNLNIEKFGYSKILIKVLKYNINLVEKYFKDKSYFFNKDFINTYIEELKLNQIIKQNFRIKKN